MALRIFFDQRRAARISAAIATAVIAAGAAVAVTPSASAQQAPAPAEQGPPLVYSPWTKFCGSDTNSGSARDVCMTLREARLETGQFLVGVGLIEPAGDAKKLFRVTLPLGTQLQQSPRVHVDEEPPMMGKFIVCLPNGCIADFDVDAEFVRKLKNGRQIVVESVNLTGQAATHMLPLTDFAKANEGPPADPKKYAEDQKKLQAEYEKKADEARRRQSGGPPGGPKR